MSIVLKFLPMFADLSFLTPYGLYQPNPANHGKYEIPFMDRMGLVFIFCIIGMSIITNIQNRRGVQNKGLIVDTSLFRVSKGFAFGAGVIVVILTALYSYFW
jgi:SSS family solute:Na+ symporter